MVESKRRVSRVWIAKRCGIGFTATALRALAACSTARTAVVTTQVDVDAGE
jgi:hypothetical protein